MGENKRLLNIHEQKFAELVAFQANTTVFQANINASFKNRETQVGQLALTMQNKSKGHKEGSKGLYGGNSKMWYRIGREKS